MDRSYWIRQTAQAPAFPELLWSRPENRRLAGKLLIIGGNAQAFAAPAQAYQAALDGGAGVCKVLLPDATRKALGPVLEAGEYAPSTPSGSFSRAATADFLEWSGWADGTLIAGDLGRNSETAIALENYLSKHSGQVTLTRDAADYFLDNPAAVLERADTTLVLSLAQLQKLAAGARFQLAFTSGMDLLKLVETLHQFTQAYPANIIVRHLGSISTAAGGRVSTTRPAGDREPWRVAAAAHASVWWLQNPDKTFEALTCAAVNYLQ